MLESFTLTLYKDLIFNQDFVNNAYPYTPKLN